MDKRLRRILPTVQKPARYVGGGYNEIIKDKAKVKLRMAFCFPDVYEIGMSNLGMRILYGCINAVPEYWCERVFAPWGDMAAAMRRENIPLYALESGDPVGDFDVIGFSLGYEMAYPTVLGYAGPGRTALAQRRQAGADAAGLCRGHKRLQPGANGALHGPDGPRRGARSWILRYCASSRRPAARAGAERIPARSRKDTRGIRPEPL